MTKIISRLGAIIVSIDKEMAERITFVTTL